MADSPTASGTGERERRAGPLVVPIGDMAQDADQCAVYLRRGSRGIRLEDMDARAFGNVYQSHGTAKTLYFVRGPASGAGYSQYCHFVSFCM